MDDDRLQRSTLVGLSELRRIRGISINTAARMIGLEVEELNKYEANPEDTPVLVAKKAAVVYGYDYNYISFLSENNPTR